MTSAITLYVILPSRDPDNVTLGLTLWVRTSVTEVTFTAMSSEVKSVADAP
jgi:hypothetical protein